MFQPTHRGRARAASVIERAGYGRVHHAAGGRSDEAEDKAMIREAVGEHEAHMHKGEPKTKLHFADGGTAHGAMAPRRLDHRARGGAKKAKHHPSSQVNIAVVPGHGGPPDGMMGPRPPLPVAPPVGAAPPIPPRPMPVAPPPGGGVPPGAMGMPGGMPRPMPVRTGGRARRKDGGALLGRGGAGAHFEGGAGGGLGRLEKRDR